MIRSLSFVWVLAGILVACNAGRSDSVAQELFNKELGEVSPDILDGYWEAQFTRDGAFQVWRLKIEEGFVSFAVRCRSGSRSLVTGAKVESEILDQESRFVMTFMEDRDFVVGDEDFSCGARLFDGSNVFMRLEGLQMSLSPGFEDIRFEKISD